MRILGLFLLLLAASLLLSALANYPLHLVLEGITDTEPHKLINNTAKLLAIPGFLLLMKWLGMLSKSSLGYGLPRPPFLREMMKGWLAGTAILLALSTALLLLGARTFKPIPEEFWTLLLKTGLAGLIGGILVGFIEETFFRGGMYGAMRRNNRVITAALLTSLFYAAMHFIKQQPLAAAEPYVWYSGLQILSTAFIQLAEWTTFDSFLALFVVGLFLALLRERSGNIAYCIGMHAGWIFVIRLMRKFTRVDHSSEFSGLVGHYDGITGYLAVVWLGLLILLYYRYWRRGS
jgi:membrane protease YdiL (CAAX protease family)